MPIYSLTFHPAYPPAAVHRVEVEVRRNHDLELSFQVRDAENVMWPKTRSPVRKDGLWQTTCFELFLQETGGNTYIEQNFSPSSEWAAYVFTSYREGMVPAGLHLRPRVIRTAEGVTAICSLNGLHHTEYKMALTAIIEETDGTKSFWALAHAPGPPDFHNPACFTATLPPPASA